MNAVSGGTSRKLTTLRLFARTNRRRVHAAAVLAGCLAASVTLASPGTAQSQPASIQPEGGSGWRAQHLTTSARHMVVAANPMAAEAGREMLRAGGSAADAAVAVQLVLGLVEPQSSGLGGGAFAVTFDSERATIETYDGRETAPASARPNHFMRDGRLLPFRDAVPTGLSVGVPGTVRLLEMLHKRHGRLPWERLFQPAIALAETGFPVSHRLATLLAADGPSRFAAGARRYFFDAAGRAHPAGHRLANPAYAAALRRIASEGAGAFYAGPIADSIVAAVRTAARHPGDLTLADLAGYRAIARPPVCVGYRSRRVCGMGAPSSGGIAIAQALMLLEPYDIGRDPRDAMAPGPVHLVAEALKLAFADRNWYVADPDRIAIPPGLLDPAYIGERRHLLDPVRTIRQPYPGLPPGLARSAHGTDATEEASGTSHVSIVDARGNAIALTTTIEAGFGSGLWASGFLLNNELTDFSFRARDRDGRPIANRIEAGKRPRSSMAPTIVLGPDGRPEIVTGSPGGSRIIAYVLKSLVAMIDWGLDPQAAAALPGFATRGGVIELEAPGGGWSPLLAPLSRQRTLGLAIGLAAVGHRPLIEPMTSGLHIIRIHRNGRLDGGADPRREGVAVGD